MKQLWKKYVLFLIPSILLIALDQWTKWLAVEKLKGKMPFTVLKDVFEFYYHENRGAAFGVLQEKRIFFIIITIVVVAVILYLYARIPENKHYLPLRCVAILIFSGALGNFIDRFFNGYVVDFLYFKLIDFPIFNVADCYVTIASVSLLILFLFYYKEEELDFLFSFSNSKKRMKIGRN